MLFDSCTISCNLPLLHWRTMVSWVCPNCRYFSSHRSPSFPVLSVEKLWTKTHERGSQIMMEPIVGLNFGLQKLMTRLAWLLCCYCLSLSYFVKFYNSKDMLRLYDCIKCLSWVIPSKTLQGVGRLTISVVLGIVPQDVHSYSWGTLHSGTPWLLCCTWNFSCWNLAWYTSSI